MLSLSLNNIRNEYSVPLRSSPFVHRKVEKSHIFCSHSHSLSFHLSVLLFIKVQKTLNQNPFKNVIGGCLIRRSLS